MTMLRKALWDLRWTAPAYAAGGAGYTFLVASFYPMVRAQAEQFQKLLAAYPKGMLVALGYTDFTSYAGYLSVESLNLFWPVIVLTFATLAGAALVAKEVEDGTTEVWLSVPEERWRLLAAKFAALAAGLLLCVVATVATIGIFGAAVGVTLRPAGLLALGVNLAALTFVVAAYSGLASALLSSRGLAAGVSLGVTFLSYAMYVVSKLSSGWQHARDFSIFTAYRPQSALESGRVEPLEAGLLLLATGACVVLALVAFQRRDAV